MTDKLSDIEKLMSDQVWKKRKLPPIQIGKRNAKIRFNTQCEKPRKQERLSTLPCAVKEDSVYNTLRERQEGKRSNFSLKNNLCALAVPFNLISSSLSAYSSKASSMDLQIPVFPKMQFGNTTRSLQIIPKFELIHFETPKEAIRDLKLEYGRIVRRKCQSYQYYQN